MTKLRRYLPVILWCAVIFTLSSWPTPPSPQDTIINFIFKKTAHIIEYAILYYLTFRAVNANRTTKVNYLGPLLFTIAYAASDEIHQSFVPGRHARLYDIGFDTLGALLALRFNLRK